MELLDSNNSNDAEKANSKVETDASVVNGATAAGDVAGNDNKMGLLSCTSYVISNIIGSGIFITPSGVLQEVNSVGLSIIIWIGCGIISLLGAIVYIELGTSILEPGCDFAYLCYVKWSSVAFAFMWVGVLLTYPASVAVQAVTFGRYIVEGFAPIYKPEPAYETVVVKVNFFPALIIWINFHSLGEFVSKFQIAATFAKLGSMGLIILAGFYWIFVKGNVSPDLKKPFENSNWHMINIILAFYSGLWSYAGWDILNYGTTELRNPRRNMPLSLIGGITVVSLIYTAINIAYFAVLPVHEFQTSDAVAASFSQRVFGKFSYAIPFMVAILICGTLNSNIFCASRYMHAAAKERHLPPFISCINEKTGSPRPSLFLQGILAMIMTFVDVNTLISYVSFIMFFQRIFTMLALLYIRLAKIPVYQGAIRLPLSLTILFLLVNIVLVSIPLVQDFKMTAIGVMFMLTGFLIYYLLVEPSSLPEIFDAINGNILKLTTRRLRDDLNTSRS
uniref:Y+L amino acid transporter 2 n=1 Tax=Syphacia muris TaxID=451379 RepID=A0A0N5ALR5_9BILA